MRMRDLQLDVRRRQSMADLTEKSQVSELSDISRSYVNRGLNRKRKAGGLELRKRLLNEMM